MGWTGVGANPGSNSWLRCIATGLWLVPKACTLYHSFCINDDGLTRCCFFDVLVMELAGI